MKNQAFEYPHELKLCLERCIEVVDRAYFETYRLKESTIGFAIFTMLLIDLNELLQFADRSGKRVTDTDSIQPDLPLEKRHPPDLTELIRLARNALCHIDSPKRNVSERLRAPFFVKAPGETLELFGGKFECAHADDLAIYIGKIRIYLRRHIYRAVALLREKLGAELRPTTRIQFDPESPR